LITSLVSFDYYVVCPLTYSFWLPLWYLLTIMLFVLWLTDSDYHCGIYWLLCCLCFDLHLLITSLVSFDYYVVCLLTYSFWLPLWYLLTIMLFVLWLAASDYPFGIFKVFLLTATQPLFHLTPCCCSFSGEATNTNVIEGPDGSMS
jgi:hypothetical protein